MNPETVEKINALAKSLKENHLVATMEEAVEKAKQILEGKEENPGLDKEGKTVKELMENEDKAADVLEKELEEVKEIKEEIKEKIKEDEKDIEETKEIAQDIREEKQGIEDAKETVELAEEGEIEEARESAGVTEEEEGEPEKEEPA